MYCGTWGGIWGYPYYFGGLIGILFQMTILVLIVWAVVTVVKNLTSHKIEALKNGDIK